MHELHKALAVDLPGQEAQYTLASKDRAYTNLEMARADPDVRPAAVLALFHPRNGESHITLIRRNSYPGVHSDQISFPGGKAEPTDSKLEETALRETEEEVGVSASRVKLLGSLTEVYIPPSGFLVRPFVGYAADELEFHPDSREVVEVLNFPVGDFMNARSVRNVRVEVRNMHMRVPAYVIGDQVIWGATAMMIGELTSVIRKCK